MNSEDDDAEYYEPMSAPKIHALEQVPPALTFTSNNKASTSKEEDTYAESDTYPEKSKKTKTKRTKDKVTNPYEKKKTNSDGREKIKDYIKFFEIDKFKRPITAFDDSVAYDSTKDTIDLPGLVSEASGSSPTNLAQLLHKDAQALGLIVNENMNPSEPPDANPDENQNENNSEMPSNDNQSENQNRPDDSEEKMLVDERRGSKRPHNSDEDLLPNKLNKVMEEYMAASINDEMNDKLNSYARIRNHMRYAQRIRGYVQMHLKEPTLTAERIKKILHNTHLDVNSTKPEVQKAIQSLHTTILLLNKKQ